MNHHLSSEKLRLPVSFMSSFQRWTSYFSSRLPDASNGDGTRCAFDPPNEPKQQSQFSHMWASKRNAVTAGWTVRATPSNAQTRHCSARLSLPPRRVKPLGFSQIWLNLKFKKKWIFRSKSVNIYVLQVFIIRGTSDKDGGCTVDGREASSSCGKLPACRYEWWTTPRADVDIFICVLCEKNNVSKHFQ